VSYFPRKGWKNVRYTVRQEGHIWCVFTDTKSLEYAKKVARRLKKTAGYKTSTIVVKQGNKVVYIPRIKR